MSQVRMTLAPDRVRSVSLMREAADETSSLEGRVGSHVAQRRFQIEKKTRRDFPVAPQLL